MATRTIVPTERYYSEQLSPGVLFEKLYPGGMKGPNNEVLRPLPGGQTWSDFIILGGKEDTFQLAVPDIRLPANQYWPMHWHDAWTMVLVLEGQCLIGDWWMEPGDLFITEPSLEYGPLVIGPNGCRMFEIFAQMHLARGGYAPEYRDHPTLQGLSAVFIERSPVNKRNEGKQTLPLGGVEAMIKTQLSPGAQWDLGKPNDPERGMMKDTRLAPNERLPAHRYGDGHAIVVLDGSFKISGQTLERDGYLSIKPNSVVAEIEAGPKGAHVLEFARTSRGMTRQPVA
jgi:quercetin dioxygenase-like cupin family protein